MDGAGQQVGTWPRCAAIFGASGGIGSALCSELAARGVATIHAGSRSGRVPQDQAIRPFRFELEDETSISAAADAMRNAPPDLVIVASGVLTLPDGTGPERSYKSLDPVVMARVFAANTIGPALVAKHMLPLLPRDRRAVLAALSARVGSIGDNRVGGWHSYRASKAGLNMLVRNFAIELGRTHKQAVVVSLHPGTVDTALSEPFRANLPDGQLTDPDGAARNLLGVIDGLIPADSGQQFDWKGGRVPD
ncbi:SDR family NAD(P)-dependent oxidoreductase [Parerythrobacter lacustris]|uniref:SDR family NAD(P)-dependent oxidoreductase n=1 Tax=Parerythrobacter lacustris TaxID=2969984 RepID=A0ABT1XSQ6_9SPHN|nr:SDR family NAD(P)-dependent oxidoreductase [Parerythrobacter lacustris]MCR2833700.1 SDR family NAD(P)-dependent oxidoreductase [Parerythrobacter lacustris]